MAATRKELEYALNNFNEVHHTTLDPEGPGVVRIHLVPPVVKDGDVGPSAAIINGQDIIPVNTSWSILLTEFIKEVNKHSGAPITQVEADSIVENTCRSVRSVYPFISRKRLSNDIFTIMDTFRRIARGQVPDGEIEYISLGEYAPLMRAPHRMDLLVSSMTSGGKWHCNQKCVHCYASGQPMAQEEELSTEEWKEVLDRCRSAGIPQVTFTGGEPTMRDDLPELISYAGWFITRLNTNGLKLTEEYCQALREASLDSVQITFYSDKSEIHDSLVGVSGYDSTVSGMENALRCGLSLSVNTPLCTLNRDYLSTLRFLHDKGVVYVTCSGLITTGNAAGGESAKLRLSEEEISGILSQAAEYCFANDMEISFTSPGWVSEEFCRSIGLTPPVCGACLSNMAVTPGGSVVPCQSWLSGEPLGNILTDSWDRIWNGQACRERRELSSHMDGLCPLRTHTGEPD
ncbi:MAG: radical SAM protein [Oscillospiraceae bacterium]|nr:radical SAM protein [Oscillospiraceae bacterium]